MASPGAFVLVAALLGQAGTALPEWKAELEVEKASGFGPARE